MSSIHEINKDGFQEFCEAHDHTKEYRVKIGNKEAIVISFFLGIIIGALLTIGALLIMTL